jgi:hypothetical protein
MKRINMKILFLLLTLSFSLQAQQFVNTKVVDRQGTIMNTSTGVAYVDMYGTRKGFAQYENCKTVDIYGDLGCAIVTGPWEMQLGTVETVGVDQGTIPNNYINAGNLTNFTSTGVTGYMSGNISGNGTFNIKNGPQTIGGVSYAGNGITIFTGTNTCAGILNMEANTQIQLGSTCSNATTRWASNLTIGSGAVATQMTSFPNATYLCQALTNTGTYNITGCGTCGVGGRNYATTVANNGVINIDKAAWGPTSNWTGGGTINVLNGGTLSINENSTTGATNTININGDGWCDATGLKVGAISKIGTTASYSFNINLQSPSLIRSTSGTTLNGKLTGNHKLTLSNATGAGTRSGSFTFTQSTAPYFDSTIEVLNTSLYTNGTNALSKADIRLVGTGFIQQDGGTLNLGSLASSQTTTGILANSSVTFVLKENGSTTYAGSMNNSTPGTPWNFRIEGPATNVIKLTNPTGNSAVNLSSSLGGRIIVEAGRYNQWSGVGTISAGSTIGVANNAHLTNLIIGASSALDVYASANGLTTGLLVGSTVSLTAGWKVNLMEPLPAGTHNILQKGATVMALPTLGTNLSGRTVVGFANSGNFITVTLL